MRLALMGDVMLGRGVNDELTRMPAEYVWGDCLDVLRAADIRLCNLECVISDRDAPLGPDRKAFRFRSDAKNIAVLSVAGLDMVSLANNHALDLGPEALLDMMQSLNAAGISWAGAGSDLTQASHMAVCEVAGFRLGLVSCTDNEPDWAAGIDRAGVFFIPIDIRDGRARRLFKLVTQRSQEADFMIVSVHWGSNWGYRPESGHEEFAHALIDAGADLVFGHSPHVVRGMEAYRRGLILYSAGNFVDDYAVDERERNDLSFIFSVDVDVHSVRRVSLYPTVIRDCRARLARGSDRDEITSTMEKLCRETGMTIRREPRRCSLAADIGAA